MAFTKAFEDAVSSPAAGAPAPKESAEEGGLFAKMKGILRRP